VNCGLSPCPPAVSSSASGRRCMLACRMQLRRPPAPRPPQCVVGQFVIATTGRLDLDVAVVDPRDYCGSAGCRPRAESRSTGGLQLARACALPDRVAEVTVLVWLAGYGTVGIADEFVLLTATYEFCSFFRLCVVVAFVQVMRRRGVVDRLPSPRALTAVNQ